MMTSIPLGATSMSSQLSPPSRQQRRLTTSSFPQDRDQRLVMTPYGRGLVLRTRPSGMQDIQMLDWDTSATTTTTTTTTTSSQQPTMLYSPLVYNSVTPLLGDDVLTVYGRGRIIGLKPPHTVIVELTSWRLAQRSTVKCYLNVNQVQVVRTKTLHEMTTAWERVQYAHELKQQATEYFGNGNYQRALECYSRAVDAVRNVQHDANSSNHVRADLVLLMITCCNNAATCCTHLPNQQNVAVLFAKNALVLIDALYEKRGMQIHSILLREQGLSDAKLFGEYKVKALLVIAKRLAEQGEYVSAIDLLKQANAVIAIYYAEEEGGGGSSRSQLISQQKQVKRLLATCVQGKKALLAREKECARAMFASPLKDTDKDKQQHKEDANPIVTPSPEAASKEIETDEELEEISSEQGSYETATTYRRSVSFADDTKPGSQEFLAERENDEEEDTPWYEEHKEALVLSAVAGLAAFSVVLLRSRRK